MDKTTPCVSVIATVYNTEPYFDRMIGSIKNQSLKDIQIIIVNDCSSGDIDERVGGYMSADARIEYYSTSKNSGVGGARNLGMRYAFGDYIMFFDGDDWMDLRTLEEMYRTAKKEDADIVNCGLYRDYNSGEEKWDCYYDRDYVVDGATAIKMLAHQYDYGIELCVSPTNKIYRRDLIKDLRFIEDVYYEEALFNYLAIKNAKKIAFVKTGRYIYFKRIGSNLQSITYKHIQDYHLVFSEIKNRFADESSSEAWKSTYVSYLEYFFFVVLEQIYESSKTEEERKGLIVTLFCSLDDLVSLSDYIDYLGTDRFRWNLQPIMMHNGERLL